MGKITARHVVDSRITTVHADNVHIMPCTWECGHIRLVSLGVSSNRALRALIITPAVRERPSLPHFKEQPLPSDCPPSPYCPRRVWNGPNTCRAHLDDRVCSLPTLPHAPSNSRDRLREIIPILQAWSSNPPSWFAHRLPQKNVIASYGIYPSPRFSAFTRNQPSPRNSRSVKLWLVILISDE